MSEFAEKEVKKEDEKVNAEEPEKNEDGEDGDDGPAAEEESTAVFAPVVQLEVVEVKTHEEDEEVTYKQRAKLFTFSESLLNKGTGQKSWNEKGTGDVKFLKHKENSRIRLLMRQEKTMKVIGNHFIDPRIVLTPNAGNDKSWVFVAFDFSGGELIETTFAIRFGTSEIANEFKENFSAAQQENEKLMGGQDSAEGAKEADEAAAAIESLAVKPSSEVEGEGEQVKKEEKA